MKKLRNNPLFSAVGTLFYLGLCCMPLLRSQEVAGRDTTQPEETTAEVLSNDNPQLRINEVQQNGVVKDQETSYLRRFDRQLFPYLDTYQIGLIHARYRNLVLKGKAPDHNRLYVQGTSMFYIHDNPAVNRTLVLLSGINGLVGDGPMGAPDDFESMFQYAKDNNYHMLLIDNYGHNVNFGLPKKLNPSQDAIAFWSFYETAANYIETLKQDHTFSYKRCAAVLDAYLQHLALLRPRQKQYLEVVAFSFGGLSLQQMLHDKRYSPIIRKGTFIAPLLLDLYSDHQHKNPKTQINFLICQDDLVLSVGRRLLMKGVRRGLPEVNGVTALRKLGFKVNFITLKTNSHLVVCQLAGQLADLEQKFNNKHAHHENSKK